MGAQFPLTVLLVSVSVPELLIPPPEVALPLRIVSFERVTWAVVLETVTTVRNTPPSIIVVLAPEPIAFTIMWMARLFGVSRGGDRDCIARCSREIARPIVLQGVVGDVQLLLSLPLTPFTYHVVLARAFEPSVHSAICSKVVISLCFIILSFSLRQHCEVTERIPSRVR
jgi:hypothetical protein